MGILIEHYAGKFPLWLAPTQVALLTISEKQNQYASELNEFLKKKGIRSHYDLRNEKIGFKIREQTLQKVPYLLIIGDKEVEQRVVTLRSLDGRDLGTMPIDTICDALLQEIAQKHPIQQSGGTNH